MESQDQEVYSDFSNVEVQRNFLTSEELPEGAYGSPIGEKEPVKNKETPWQDGQQFYSNFAYENRTLHEDMPRQMEGSHPTHDQAGKDTDPSYDQTKTSQEK